MKIKYPILLICFLLLFFYGKSQDISNQDSLSTHQEIEEAPNFYLMDLHGNGHFLNDYCGEKKSKYKKNKKEVVLLSFWATWCLPCREEYKILEKLSQHYSDDSLMIFLINIEEPFEKVKRFVIENDIKIPVLLDRYGVVRKNYRVSSIPALFLINPEQQIIYKHIGYNPEEPLLETLIQKIDSLLVHFY